MLALLEGGPSLALTVIALYSVVNLVIQSVIQPKLVGDAVGLSATLTFLSLIVWAGILGPIGAVMAVPLTLLVKAVLVDVDPQARWIGSLLGDRRDPPDHADPEQTDLERADLERADSEHADRPSRPDRPETLGPAVSAGGATP